MDLSWFEFKLTYSKKFRDELERKQDIEKGIAEAYALLDSIGRSVEKLRVEAEESSQLMTSCLNDSEQSNVIPFPVQKRG